VLDKVARLFVLPPITRDKVLKVPGFTTTDGDRLTVVPTAGLLIPLTDSRQRIVAIKVRLDRPGRGGKYLYLSSTGHGGPGPGSPLHYPPPHWHRGFEDVRITEGELKADVATARTGIKTFGVPGCSSWRMALAVCEHPMIETVRLAFDSDANKNPVVGKALLDCARAVRELDQARRAETVAHLGVELIVEVWPKEFKGIDDLLVAGGTPTEYRGEAAMAEAKKIAKAAGVNVDGQARDNQDQADDKRPVIIVTEEEHDTNRQAAAALSDHTAVYARGNALVHIVRPAAPRWGVRRPDAPRIEVLDAAIVRERLTQVARFAKWKDKRLVPCHPPDWCVAAVCKRKTWRGLPLLEGIATYPVLKPDGTVLCSPGYDADTGLYLTGLPELPPIPGRPTRRQAVEARDLLLDLVADFPFAREFHKAAWLAGLLTLLARFAFTGPAPLFLADGNKPGCGKGLLFHVIAAIVTGQEMRPEVFTEDEAEMRKKITAIAVEGETVILFDNITGCLGGAPLNAILTHTSWKERILGFSRRYNGPLLCTWFATANNAQVEEDTIRRSCPIRLETPEEAPEERKDFTHPKLIEHVIENRGGLLAAALTILRGFCVAGRPDMKLTAWGSFQPWSDLVRQCIVWCGMEDPAQARRLLRQRADVTNDSLKVLMTGWREMDPKGKGLTCSQVITRLFGAAGVAPLFTKEWEYGMKVAVEDLLKEPSGRTLGYLLRSKQRTPVGGYFFDQTDPAGGGLVKWVVLSRDEFAARGGRD
jgi:hypothetical protein